MASRVLLMGILLLGSCLAPSVDMARYRAYYAQQEGPPAEGEVALTYFGVSTLLFDDGRTQILIDGWFSRHGIPKLALGKIATDTATVDTAVAAYALHRTQAIFVTHSHYDHVSDVAYVARQTGATLYGSESTLNVGRGGQLPESQMALFEPGKPVAVGDFTVMVIPARHTPPVQGINDLDQPGIEEPLRQPAPAKHYYEGGSYDFLITHGSLQVLVKPSTNWVPGALDTVRADVLLLGVAGYGRESAAFRDTHYRETVTALDPHTVIPIHWDYFMEPFRPGDLQALPRLIDRDFPQAFEGLIQRVEGEGRRFRILQGGHRWVLGATEL